MSAIVQHQSVEQPRFLGALFEPQTYRNLLYLLLAFPLGLAYFVFLVTGLSLGVGLLITLLGLPILALVLAAGWGLAAFERRLAGVLLGAHIPAPALPAPTGDDLWARLKAHLHNPLTWTSLAYLVVKFPLGLVSFVVMVTLLALTAVLIAAPFLYRLVPLTVGVTSYGSPLYVVTLGQALTCALVGVMLGIGTLYLGNGLAAVYRRLAESMLGR